VGVGRCDEGYRNAMLAVARVSKKFKASFIINSNYRILYNNSTIPYPGNCLVHMHGTIAADPRPKSLH